jgi:hypothetical protein
MGRHQDTRQRGAAHPDGAGDVIGAAFICTVVAVIIYAVAADLGGRRIDQRIGVVTVSPGAACPDTIAIIVYVNAGVFTVRSTVAIGVCRTVGVTGSRCFIAVSPGAACPDTIAIIVYVNAGVFTVRSTVAIGVCRTVGVTGSRRLIAVQPGAA